MKRNLSTFIFGILYLAYSSNAQIIGSLKILPANPLNTQSINLECHAFFGSGGARLDSAKVKIDNFSINVSGYYFRNGTASPSETTDTIIIGKLNAGNYKLIYNLIEPWGKKDADTINFAVGINKIANKENPKIKIFPNSHGSATFSLPDTKKYSIVIFNYLCQQVGKTELAGSTNYELTMPYSPGLYYVNAKTADNIQYTVLLRIE